MNRLITAKSLRMSNISIPDYIPDRAVIDPDHINAKIGLHYGIGDMMPTQYIESIRVDWEFFTWEPCRRPTNARPLVSRNKREGFFARKYKGRYYRVGIDAEDRYPHITALSEDFHSGKNRNRYVATTAEEAEAILDKIISKGTS